MTTYAKITIKQIDRQSGKCYRQFTRYANSKEHLEEVMRSIRLAYNMDATEITVEIL